MTAKERKEREWMPEQKEEERGEKFSRSYNANNLCSGYLRFSLNALKGWLWLSW